MFSLRLLGKIFLAKISRVLQASAARSKAAIWRICGKAGIVRFIRWKLFNMSSDLLFWFGNILLASFFKVAFLSMTLCQSWTIRCTFKKFWCRNSADCRRCPLSFLLRTIFWLWLWNLNFFLFVCFEKCFSNTVLVGLELSTA